MKFSFFFRALMVGAIATFLAIVLGLSWLASQSSLGLLTGGVAGYPQATAFLPKQTPAMVSLLTNPEKLNALRQTILPLNNRRRDRTAWQQWETDLVHKIGFDYQRDFKPWLGDEVTLAIASLDYDRNSDNGVQPGYILATQTKNADLAQECLYNFYGDSSDITVEKYKGANIISPKNSSLWSSVVLGDFVLFANHSPLLKEAINQAQAVDLNLQHSKDYQTALGNIDLPHIGIGYIDVLGLSAWLDEIYNDLNAASDSLTVTNYGSKQTLSLALSIEKSDLAAQATLIKPNDAQIGKSFLDNPQLKQIFNSLDFNHSNSAYIDLQVGKSLLEDRIPLYKVSKLAIRSLFPYLKAIVIQNLERQENFSRADILFKLDK